MDHGLWNPSGPCISPIRAILNALATLALYRKQSFWHPSKTPCGIQIEHLYIPYRTLYKILNYKTPQSTMKHRIPYGRLKTTTGGAVGEPPHPRPGGAGAEFFFPRDPAQGSCRVPLVLRVPAGAPLRVLLIRVRTVRCVFTTSTTLETSTSFVTGTAGRQSGCRSYLIDRQDNGLFR